MPTEILRSRDLSRHAGRSLTRLEVTDHAVVVVVHELGPPRGPDDEARSERWHTWVDQLEPPTLTDDRGTVYALERRAEARGPGGNPRTDELPMKATVMWRFVPQSDAGIRHWVVDGRWTVERP